MKRSGLFPGSFDPFTKGHEAVVLKALAVFDEIIIGVGINSKKQSYFTLESRMEHIASLFVDYPAVKVCKYQKLTVDFCKEIGATHIVRGLRDSKDFEYEKTIADANRTLDPTIETIFLTGEPKYTSVASTIVRDIIRNGGDASPFLPDVISRSIPAV